ncbi:MAG: GNAT family N-acetyltransferase [Alphaproteobacteria bacterium]|nr:GNAT family N-acetyltransferase [Alphaproteobacteria bacterium]
MARAPKKHPVFVTPRLRLRPFRTADIVQMHRLYGDADNLRYWSVPPSPDLASTRRMLRWHQTYRPGNYVLWAVALKRSDKAIGMINYHHRNLREKRVDVGWLLLPGMQGKGYMAEAGRALLAHLFDDLGVHKVEALIRPENKPSTALAERLGFRLEGGPIRDRWRIGEAWHSVMLYGLVAGEQSTRSMQNRQSSGALRKGNRAGEIIARLPDDFFADGRRDAPPQRREGLSIGSDCRSSRAKEH